MKYIDVDSWNRKRLFNHFMQLKDPYFGVVVPFDVTRAFEFSKENNVSFFVKYLHDCMKAINAVDNFRYRIIDDNVVDFEVIHASATIAREDNTYGFSFINYSEDLEEFISSFNKEKQRIQNSDELYPPVNGQDCIHCSALPWFQFSGHKEPSSGNIESIPELAFSKFKKEGNQLIMNVSIHVNHALVDGYHVGQFVEKFQNNLNT
ncbi:CatA-like O-acetyltransferase [Winogradskyella marincola]|uniref:CatA-like O-acetyltransferase n=1 Tax=Winogradskyella marincola TaxID=3037795 RepID=A0ABT6G1D7_9FLAO|nr:CatA-like O-acetyltransferase [Winogradskyella sp. YYF002]MDG4715770.1 CatA-like O-acetyltransferase [Winogradskyella sp. YYF002]